MSLFFVIIPKYLHRDNAVWPSPIDKVPVLFFPTMCRCPYGALYWPTNNRPRFFIIKDRPSHLPQWIEVCSTSDEVNNDTNSIFFYKDKLPKKKRSNLQCYLFLWNRSKWTRSLFILDWTFFLRGYNAVSDHKGNPGHLP